MFRPSNITLFLSFFAIVGFALSRIDYSPVKNRPEDLNQLPLTVLSLLILASVGFYLISLQISRLKNSRARIKKWRRASIRSSKSAHQFIIDRIVDMRRPLQGLVGIKDLYKDSDSAEEGIDFLEIADHCSRYLMRQLERLQMYSELELGNSRFDNTTFKLRQCVQSAIELASEQSKNNQASIQVDFGQNLPEYVTGSELALRKILTELIDNSIRHSGNSKTVVKIFLDPEDPSQIRFLVNDDGVGISTSKIEELAAPLPWKKHSLSWVSANQGLGLLLIRRILEEVEGEFQVQSSTGKGTSFSFVLPRDKLSAALPPRQAPEIDTAKFIALVVDDEEVTRQVLSAHLRRLNVHFDVAVNGYDAIEMAKETPYDVIFMDLSMPVVDGFVASRTILNLEDTMTKPKIIVASSHCRQEDIDRCTSIGVSGFLAKPIGFDVLHSCLRKLGFCQPSLIPQPSNVVEVDFKKQKPRQKVRAQIVENYIEFDALLHSLGGNEQMCYELLMRISRDTATALEELAIALKDVDRKAMSKVLHRVHGELAMIHCVRGLDKLVVMQETISNAPLEVMENQFNEIGDFIESLCNEIDRELAEKMSKAS